MPEQRTAVFLRVSGDASLDSGVFGMSTCFRQLVFLSPCAPATSPLLASFSFSVLHTPPPPAHHLAPIRDIRRTNSYTKRVAAPATISEKGVDTTDVGRSAWNDAGTWEEVEKTDWCKGKLTEAFRFVLRPFEFGYPSAFSALCRRLVDKSSPGVSAQRYESGQGVCGLSLYNKLNTAVLTTRHQISTTLIQHLPAIQR